MLIKVDTFNPNNLFARLNFSAAIQNLSEGETAGAMTFRYEFSADDIRVRTYRGKLVNAKPHEKTVMMANRILEMDLGVLAVQEVEDIHVMKSFNKKYLQNLYPHQVLIEGNDPRFIDVALFSKLPLGAVTTFQTAVHRDAPQQRVFGRDLLEVEILNENRTRKLFELRPDGRCFVNN